MMRGQFVIALMVPGFTCGTFPIAEIRAAMAKKSEEFKQGGGEIYIHKPAAE